MNPVRRAVIDVGTNSIKLLVAEVEKSEVRPLLETSHQTRLGEGLYHSHQLQPGPLAKTAQAVADFVAKARREQAASIRVIATSAARDAVNAADLISAIHRACNLDVEIISGEQEADWVFRGVTTDPALAHAPLLLLDVGGGSTEFILGQGQQKHFASSFPLGTVRLLEKLPHGDPPPPQELAVCRHWLDDFLQKEVLPRMKPALNKMASRKKGAEWILAGGITANGEYQIAPSPAWPDQMRLIGTGGTASILGCMEAELKTFDRQRLEATRLSRKRLSWYVEWLWSLPLAKRKLITGLPPNRADVILMGAAIYEAVMRQFEFEELGLSTRGLRYAALMDPP